MSGFAIRQQGPMGVATASRTLPASGTRVREAAPASEGTTLSPHRRDPFPNQGDHQESPENPEPGMPAVDPSTLFAASQLAPSRPLGEAEAGLHLGRLNRDWAPPASTLSLRDRSV